MELELKTFDNIISVWYNTGIELINVVVMETESVVEAVTWWELAQWQKTSNCMQIEGKQH